MNAYTSFDETVYMLDVPTEKPGVLERGFEALSDFAGGLTLDPEEIDRERGVVIEEWRGRLGAGTRMQEPQMKALFGASRYINRLPIGTPEILNRVITATASRIVASGESVIGLRMIPLSDLFTRSTSAAWRSIDMFL